MVKFENILGQVEVKQSLLTQSKSTNLHHAHLFIGKMGYGTLQLAMSFVKYVYCQDKSDTDACDACSNCIKINKFEHPDIHFTLPSFNTTDLSARLMPEFRSIFEEKIGVFDIKDWIDYNKEKNTTIRASECDIILNNMSMSSFESGYKAQIIWMVELMGRESNKILKILEEPNPNTLFILIAESAEHILPTILSRCNIHKVLPHQKDILDEYLTNKYPNRKDEIDKALIFAEGDIIDAERYLAEESSGFNLEENLKEFLYGMVKFNERKYSNISRALKQAEVLAGQPKTNQKKFLEFFQYYLRQLMYFKVTGECQLNQTLSPSAIHFASILEVDQIEYWNQIVDKIYRANEGNANTKISFVSLAIESGKIQSRKEFEELVYKI